jgi:hypothetical protein
MAKPIFILYLFRMICNLLIGFLPCCKSSVVTPARGRSETAFHFLTADLQFIDGLFAPLGL